MKEYLQLFRDQAFSGAWALTKRTLLSNIIIAVLLGVISILSIVPLFLKGIGWNFTDLMSFNEKFKPDFKNIESLEKLQSEIMGTFGQVNYWWLAISIVLVLIFSAFQYLAFFTLNDNAVRRDNTGIMDTLKMSLNGKIFRMLGLYFTMMILSIGIFFMYFLILTPLFMFSNILGALVGFILFFVMFLLIIRLLIAPAALVHGDMGIMAAIGYSYKNITWKRAGILFLMGLIFMIAYLMLASLIGSITVSIFGIGNTNMNAIVITQIIESAIGAILSAFLYCSMSAIYFRYSNDQPADTENIGEHLIG